MMDLSAPQPKTLSKTVPQKLHLRKYRESQYSMHYLTVCMCVGGYVTCGGQRTTLDVISQVLSTLVFETSSLIGLELPS